MIEVEEREHTLACMEVWGSNHNVVRTVELPELIAWVYSRPAELGRDRLMEWARLAPVDDPASTGHALLVRLNEFRRDNFTDDETLIIIHKR